MPVLGLRRPREALLETGAKPHVVNLLAFVPAWQQWARPGTGGASNIPKRLSKRFQPILLAFAKLTPLAVFGYCCWVRGVFMLPGFGTQAQLVPLGHEPGESPLPLTRTHHTNPPSHLAAPSVSCFCSIGVTNVKDVCRVLTAVLEGCRAS